MLKNLLFVISLCMLGMPAICQFKGIHGIVADSNENKNLANALITVLRKSDSTLLSFTRSDAKGKFLIDRLSLDSGLLILITYPSYADFMDEFSLSGAAQTNLGAIYMRRKAELLKEVIISNASAIRIKGDTTEYKADSFHLRAGSTVEELLKNLPGIQVDKNGKITAQGETVQKVLVDGEEFFSDDPTIVTKNMLSDAIDKVQVYDKKSDQSAFTGVDDGQKMKTIDLKLKSDRKKGYFGKMELGSNGKDYWNNNIMVNAFKGKRKLSAFGIMSSTGKIGLNWDETGSYGQSNMEMSFEGGYTMISYSGDYDDFEAGEFYGEGLPKGWNAGLQYSNKFKDDKISVNGSYTYKKLNAFANGSIQSKYILPDTLYYINESGDRFSSRFRNSVGGIYEYQIDSSSNIKVTGKGFYGSSTNVNHSSSEALDESGKFVNTSSRLVSSIADNRSINTSAIYRKKFKKAGRTVSVNLSQNYTGNESDGKLQADYDYYDATGAIKSSDTTDQQKLKNNSTSKLNARFVYTEPMSKNAILEFNYGVSNTDGHSAITTRERQAPGLKYETVIDSLTNEYRLNVLSNSGGVNYRYSNSKKLMFSFGGNIAKADFTRNDILAKNSLSYSFINFFPRASLSVPIPGFGFIRLNYSGDSKAPTVDQIQPLRDNTDELNQRIGNPDLKQSFNHQLNLNINSFKVLSERYLGYSLYYFRTDNDFSTNNFVDELGKRLTQPVNVNGNHTIRSFAYYDKRISKKGLFLGINGNSTISTNTNFINSIENKNKNITIGAGPSITLRKDKKYDLRLSTYKAYNRTKSSIRPDEIISFFSQEYYMDMAVFLPKKFDIGTDGVWSTRQKTDAFDKNANFFKWNAFVSKKFLKNDAGSLRFTAFDILNQNIGFQRDLKSNFISEKNFNTFRRYFMLSFTYNFTKNGASKPQ